MHTIYRKQINPFRCPIANCDASFNRDGELQIHLNIHNNLVHYCYYCPFRSASTQSLKAWIGAIELFCVGYCVGFFLSNPIKTHYNNHFQIREYECDQCHKKFVTSNALNLHFQAHEGIVYKCKLCPDYSAKSKTTVSFHFRVHHPNTVKICHWDFIQDYVRQE